MGVLYEERLRDNTKMELEELRAVIRRHTEERSDLSRDAREVGESLAHLPD